MSEPAGYQKFFAELKRRKVFRVMAVYGTVAFILLQLADISFEPLGLPESAMTFLIVLALFGFPIAVILAWAFEVTPEGVRKTEDAAPGEITGIIEAPASTRWPAGVLAVIGVAALVWGAWFVGKRAGESESADPSLANTSTAVSGEQQPSGVQLAYAELSRDARPSIAVLPFADMSQQRDQEYFSDGITEEILNVLARIPELRVAARTTAFAYKGQDPDLREVGDNLGVRYVLEGSVRKAGDDLRITAQLIDTQDNFHVWSESYDRTLDNVFEIQSEIAEAIAEALKVPLGVEQGSDLVFPTADMAAYDLYLEGQAKVKDRGAENIADATTLFEAAIARDSGWAPAWAGLAMARTLEPYYQAGWDGPSEDAEVWDRALSAAGRRRSPGARTRSGQRVGQGGTGECIPRSLAVGRRGVRVSPRAGIGSGQRGSVPAVRGVAEQRRQAGRGPEQRCSRPGAGPVADPSGQLLRTRRVERTVRGSPGTGPRGDVARPRGERRSAEPCARTGVRAGGPV